MKIDWTKVEKVSFHEPGRSFTIFYKGGDYENCRMESFQDIVDIPEEEILGVFNEITEEDKMFVKKSSSGLEVTSLTNGGVTTVLKPGSTWYKKKIEEQENSWKEVCRTIKNKWADLDTNPKGEIYFT